MAFFKVKSLMLHVLPEEDSNMGVLATRILPEGMGCCNTCASCSGTCGCSCTGCTCTCSGSPCTCTCSRSRTASASEHNEESTYLSELAILKDQLKHALAQVEEMAAVF